MKFFELIFDYPGPSSLDGTSQRAIEALDVADKIIIEVFRQNFIKFIDSYKWTDKILYKIIRSDSTVNEVQQLMNKLFPNRNQPSWIVCGKGQYKDATSASLQVKFVNEIINPNEIMKYSSNKLSIIEKFKVKYKKTKQSDIFL